MDRTTHLLAMADRSRQLLEIGAGYSPIAPKSGGWRTHVVDHAPRHELCAKYAPAGVDIDSIEEVDTIWHDGPLHEAVPADPLGGVDTIIASHMLEHIPDLIGFLQSAQRLVVPGGCLSVALPDRRYCFDCLKPWSATGDLLDAHNRGLRRHSLRTAYNHMAYSATVDGGLAWGPRRVGLPVLMDPFEAAARTIASFDGDAARPYEDYHAWQFTPAGFQLVMLELGQLGLTDWRIESLEGPENFEFFVLLRRNSGIDQVQSGLQAARQALLLRQLKEAREQIDFMLAGTEMAMPATARTEDVYRRLADKLAEQDSRLREMAETLAWLRAMLRPVRTVWRTLRARR